MKIMSAPDKPKEIAFSKHFKRDLAKLSPQTIISPRFSEVMLNLTTGQPLPSIYKDHALEGKLKGCRDCHIYSDLVLIYKIENAVLSFIRIGTHSDIFKP